MDSFQITILISAIVYLGFGWYAGRRVKHLDDYYVAGRNAPTVLILGTLVASFMSTNAFMGEAGMSYQGHAPLIIIMTLVNCVGYVIGAFYFGRYLRRSRSVTVPAFFYARFNSLRIQQLAGLSIVMGLSAYLLAVTWGVSLIVTEVTGFDDSFSIILVWLSYTTFTLYSGSRGVILTDTIMFVLFTIMIVVATFAIVEAGGGWHSVISGLASYENKPGIISWHGVVGPMVKWETPTEALMWAVILGFAWGMVVAVSPWQCSRYLMARSEHVVIRSACGALVAMLVLYVIINFAASAVNLINPGIDPPESVMIWVANHLLPTYLGALLICGVLAAGLSSASTFLSLVGFSVSHDILGTTEDRGPATETAQHLRAARLAMLGTGVVVVSLALGLPRDIFWITYFAGPLFASSWGAVAIMSVWSASITEAGAFWGMVSGFVVNVAMNIFSFFNWISWPVILDPILIGAVCSLITIISVSWFGKVSRYEEEYRIKLHIIPKAELDVRAVCQTLRWPKAMVVFGFVISIALMMFYAIPYERYATYVATDAIENV